MAKDWLKGIKSAYDTIIIGSGLAGLTAANKLAKLGHKVLILEHHYNLGGLATWFKRKGGHILDISLHGFPTGMIKTCRKYWTKEIADSIVRLKNIRFDNPQFSFGTNFDKNDFTRIMREQFGIVRETIDDFFKTVREMNFYDDLSMTTRELFEKFFPGRNDVHRLLMEPITYANGSTLDDPAITYGIVFSNFMDKGVYTFKGGTNELIKKMKKELLKNGVDIRTHCLVEKIEVEDNQVRGVRVQGRFIPATTVLSNSNILTTVHKLTGDEHFSEDFLEEVKKVRLNDSSCQVYIGIKKGEKIDHVGDLLFTSAEKEFSSESLLEPETTSRTFSFYYPDIRPGLNMYSIVASTNARFRDWANLTRQEYENKKNQLIERTLDALEKYVPGVRKKIDHLEASTPVTFKRYTTHPGGVSFGTKFEGLKVSKDLPKQISGLFHAGSVGIIMSGWLGAANYGVIVSNEVDKFLNTVNSPRELETAGV
ncbi:MAG: FAD-dependent oxidoreductase [Nitrospinaceae bacterium]|nr:NAD(P)/FAD-dependent oxidoreductase [Nitrospinaceae bacterium]NIR56799.1 NAD(P)/FAD-dependent oxidoreductase [Nitrospinaceae bacterium]NIS87255.1 NAD(P)/FAD-dependent oxidoreductase [Nitrospinaceae bacterium]NIT82409.1 NAD(P)/FAD-dependent oxidoreductase [Nitrospinaceae bacterium]NIU44622.1 NAD(P)/FAD-dependent oxidoreductase [Nitrospinaceae bacterium]